MNSTMRAVLPVAPDKEVPRTTIRLLGDIAAVCDGVVRQPRTRKARAMLACLALEPGGLSRRRLAVLLWSDRAEEQAQASVRQAIYELRSLLGADALTTSGDRVALAPDVTSDAHEVVALARAGSFDDLLDRLDQLPLLPLQGADAVDEAFDEWLRDARSRLSGDLASAARAAAEQALEMARPEMARNLACQALRLDPFDEAAVRIALRADAAASDQATLHRRYRDFVARLASDLDATPSAKTRALYDALRDERDRPAPVSASSPAPLMESRKRQSAWGWIVAAMLVLLAAGLAVHRWMAAPAAEPIIAVLPFQDLSSAPNRYFASGVAEELQNLLARAPHVEVLGRTSASQFARSGDVLAAARQLRVSHLLDGSVRSEGDRVRVIVRLVRVDDGAQLWSERYDRRLTDVLAVQNDIASAVMRRFSGAAPVMPQAAEAPQAAVYDRYLAARSLMRDRRETPLALAERSLREAIAMQPGYAPAHALLAQVLMLEARHPVSYGAVPYERALEEATREAKRAIALDPALGEAYAAMGLLTFSNASSLPYYRRAVALDPQRADVHRWLGQALMAAGRRDEALGEFRRTVAIDPLWGLNSDHLIAALWQAGRQDEAAAVARRFLALSRDELSKAQVMMTYSASRGRLADSYRYAARVAQLAPDEPQSRFRLASQLAALGSRAAAAREIAAEDWAGRLATADRNDALASAVERHGPVAWETGVDVWSVGDRLVTSGHGDTLLRLFDRRFGNLAGYRAREELDVFEAGPIIVALRQHGRGPEAARLVDRLKQQADAMQRQLPTMPGLPVQRALVAALAGQRDDALALLAQVAARTPAQLVSSPYRPLADTAALQGLRGDPRLAAIDRTILDYLNSERRRLGWQPLAV